MRACTLYTLALPIFLFFSLSLSLRLSVSHTHTHTHTHTLGLTHVHVHELLCFNHKRFLCIHSHAHRWHSYATEGLFAVPDDDDGVAETSFPSQSNSPTTVGGADAHEGVSVEPVAKALAALSLDGSRNSSEAPSRPSYDDGDGDAANPEGSAGDENTTPMPIEGTSEEAEGKSDGDDESQDKSGHDGSDQASLMEDNSETDDDFHSAKHSAASDNEQEGHNDDDDDDGDDGNADAPTSGVWSGVGPSEGRLTPHMSQRRTVTPPPSADTVIDTDIDNADDGSNAEMGT